PRHADPGPMAAYKLTLPAGYTLSKQDAGETPEDVQAGRLLPNWLRRPASGVSGYSLSFQTRT
ncbi:MAG TPA: hypothetical protein VJN48_16715, partial [Terriglobales bacterium]|nr:hypothetical protein [Terriglobales bacterium]